jgi:phytoene synthase
MPPRSPEPVCAGPADLNDCTTLLRGGSRSFYAASLLLPRGVREPATALYAFCRLADDAVDLGARGPDALAHLRERLDRIYAGRPLAIAADCAFTDVVARFALPRALPDALLEGFEWDAAGRRYENIGELHAYAARVAGSVGAMMAILMRTRDAEALARACDLGVAMQLTNIARDVGEDARAGRLYLPLQFMREAGLDPEAWLARPQFSAALGHVIERVLHDADVLYARAAAGIASLPWACQPAMHAARLIYAEIGREVERRGLDAVTQRAHVPHSRKLRLIADALGATISARRRAWGPPLPATRYLVEAALTTRAAAPAASSAHRLPWWNLHDRLVRVIHLFEQLERRDRTGGSDGASPGRSNIVSG